MRVHEARRLVGTVLVGVVVAGCGTTVPLAAQPNSAGPGAPEAGFEAPGQGTPEAVPGLEEALGGASNGDSGGTGAGSAPVDEFGVTGSRATGSSGSSPTRVASGQAAAPVARGTGPIEIGIAYKRGSQAAGEASGFKISSGDGKAVFDAVIDEINRTGGLAGRKLVPVYGVIEAAGSETGAQIDQRLCSLWTEDHKVAAVATGGSFTDVLPGCLQDKGIPFIFVSPKPSDADAYRRFPLMTSLYPSQHRATRAWVDLLAQQRWFGTAATTKVGVLRYDLPDQKRVLEQVLRPALKRHGIDVAKEAAVTSSSTQEAVTQGQSALLAFQAAGVTHILPMDTDGNMVLFGMKLAESNNYRPKWGLTSYVLPYIQQTNNQAQLSGSGGLGWAPSIDVDDAHDPGPTQARKTCLEIMRRAGVQTVDRTSVFAVSYSCDLLFLLRAVADRGGMTDTRSFRAAADGVRAFDSAAFTQLGFSPERRDGAGTARYFAWDDGCACFTYRTPAFRF